MSLITSSSVNNLPYAFLKFSLSIQVGIILNFSLSLRGLELNKQVNAELYSGYLYLSMASYFEDDDLLGFANWMRVQAQKELEHGMKIYDYIIRRGGSVKLDDIWR